MRACVRACVRVRWRERLVLYDPWQVTLGRRFETLAFN